MPGYEDISPEEYLQLAQYLSEFGLLGDQIPEMQHGRALAEQMRATPTPRPRAIGNDQFGSIIRKPTILEGLSAGLESATGDLQKGQFTQQIADAMRKRRGLGVMGAPIMGKVMGVGAQPPPGPQQVYTPGDYEGDW